MNPETLQILINLNVGKMSPIGSSHETKQYASTQSPSFSIELFFSAAVAYRRKYEYPSIDAAMNWLSANGYGRERGIAPDPLLILWPNVLSLTYAVESISISYLSFSRFLQTKTGRVTLTGGELHTEFHSYENQLTEGFQRAVVNNDTMTGPPLNVSGSRRSTV